MISISYKPVVQGSIVILIFAYIALGPYASIYQQAVGQIQGPAEFAYQSVKNGVSDIFLLATNPTAWYAKQQVVNAQPEKPLSFAKTLEVTTLDVTPPSVPGGQPFVLNAVLQNQGDLAVRNVRMALSCNDFCKVPPSDPVLQQRKDFHLCVEDNTFTANQISCAEGCGTYLEPRNSTGGYPAYSAADCVAKCVQSESTTISNIAKTLTFLRGTVDICTTKDASKLTQDIYYRYTGSFEKGDSDIVNIQPFLAVPFTGREAETRIAKVFVNVSFDYSTTSQLLVSVIGSEEKSRLVKENNLEFKPVVATEKVTPAKLSINVGPQPLLNNTDATLLISVSNDRSDSRILLKKGDVILITLPRDIGQDLTCSGSSSTATSYSVLGSNGVLNEVSKDQVGAYGPDMIVSEILHYSIEPSPNRDYIEILPFQFNTVYVFLCRFKTKDIIDTQKTAIITANLTNYRFVHTLTKDVPITTPIGILYDPYESKCNKCQSGLNCKPDECHSVDPMCFFEYAGTGLTIGNFQVIPTPQSLFGNPCHSCSLAPKCEQFNSEPSCLVESLRCGIKTQCEWDPNTKHPISGVEVGSCKSTTKPVIPGIIIGRTYTVRASREGNVGKTTSTGHVVAENDRFAALPEPSVRNYEIQITYKGKSINTKVLDVGPWYTDDPYWATVDGIPQAQKDWSSNVAVSRGVNQGKYSNGAGIDLADGIYYELLDAAGIDRSNDPGILDGVQWSFVSVCNPIAAGPYLSDAEYKSIYGSSQAEIESKLVTTSFMGRSVQFHTKAVAALSCVQQEIKVNCPNLNNYDFWRDSSGGTYNYRYNTNDPSRLSLHAYGIAIDINPSSNPNTNDGVCHSDIPSCVVDAFKKYGFFWGCDYSGSIRDAMHFEWRGQNSISSSS